MQLLPLILRRTLTCQSSSCLAPPPPAWRVTGGTTCTFMCVCVCVLSGAEGYWPIVFIDSYFGTRIFPACFSVSEHNFNLRAHERQIDIFHFKIMTPTPDIRLRVRLGKVGTTPPSWLHVKHQRN